MSAVLGRPMRLVVVPGGTPEAEPDATAPRKRQSADDDREARLKAYRAIDPVLDNMAQMLDLELTE